MFNHELVAWTSIRYDTFDTVDHEVYPYSFYQWSTEPLKRSFGQDRDSSRVLQFPALRLEDSNTLLFSVVNEVHGFTNQTEWSPFAFEVQLDIIP